MSMDLTGITNKNEYYTNHYFSTVFEENASTTISAWNAAAKESEEVHTPWSMLRQNARQFYAVHDRFTRSSLNMQALNSIRTMADAYLESLGYPNAKPENIAIDDTLSVPIYLEMTKSNGAPLLWVLLSASKELDAGILESYAFDSNKVEEDATGTLYKGILHELVNEDLATKILFGQAEPPRFLLFVGMNQIALVDRNKWNEKRYLQFDLEEIFARNENSTLQAMSVLMHKDSLCPEDGKVLLDELDEQSQKNASGVSQDLKYALRESIELLGNEVLYDMKTRLGRDLEADPVDAGRLTIECLRYMYQLKLSMARAKQIDIIVSFLMESGVRMLLSDLKAALHRGVRIRILTGNYLGITQPSALFLLKKELGDKVELRFYNDKNRSFHPKSYIFHYENLSEIYIGSSNISRSALTSGIEWNYRFNNSQDSQNFKLFYETFEDLFKNHSYVIDDAELKAYSKNWHKPAVAKDLARYDQTDPDTKVEVLFQPRGAQIEALCALENSRVEGASRGLVHAATGVGKTYLAAFDSAKYERVLFVAHREEILKQAAVSFKNVRHSDD